MQQQTTCDDGTTEINKDDKAVDNWGDEVSRMIYAVVGEMFRSQRHTDTNIIVQNKTFKCHRVILSAMSSYFDAMFASGMRESRDGEVKLMGVGSQIFEDILTFIYSGEKTVNSKNAEELLRACSMLQIKQLHSKCEDFLLEEVSIDNCLGAWKLGKSHDCLRLAQKAWNFVMVHFVDVCKTDDFNYLDYDELTTIIMDDELHAETEEIICDAVFKWYRHDQQNRKKHTAEMFEYLRLPLLSSEYLLHEVEPLDFVMENTRCRDFVKEAISYQMLPARRADFTSPRVQYRRHSPMEEVLLILGGYNAVGDKVIDVTAYSFNQNKWYTLTSLPTKLGREFSSCMYGNDIFISGGSQKLDCLLRYRSEYNEWYKCSSMIRGRRRHAMVAVGDSIYVLGGYDDNVKDEQCRTLSSVEEYNISSRTWRPVGNVPIPVRSMSAVVSKEKIIVFGGILEDEKESSAIQYFDTRSHTGSHVSDLLVPSKMTRAIVCEKRVFILCTDGLVLELNEKLSCEKAMEIKQFSRRRFGAVHHKGCLLIIGGETGNTLHQDIIELEPDAKDVRVLNNISLPPRANFASVKIVINKKFLKREWNVDTIKT